MTADQVLLLPTLLLWLPVVFRMRALRRRPNDRAQQAAFLASFTFALAATALVPAAYGGIGRLTGVPNLARYVGDALVVVSCWCSLVFLVHITEPEDAARRWAARYAGAFLIALVMMSGLFAAAHASPEAWRFDPEDVHGPYLLVFRLVFFAALAVGGWHGIRLLWRYGLAAREPALHLGTRLMALGNVFGMAYVTQQSLYVSSRLAGFRYPFGDPAQLGAALVAGFMLCMLVGATLPAWGRRVGVAAVYRWLGEYRTYRRLYPLWRALVMANPGIALLPPRPLLLDALTVRRLRFRLVRRVVEIWDGRLALQPYSDAATRDEALTMCQRLGLPEDRTHAIVEAARLASALQAKTAGRPPMQPTVPFLPPQGRQSADFDGDVAFLGEVAHHFSHSAIVRAVARHVSRGPLAPVPGGSSAGTRLPDVSSRTGPAGDTLPP